MFSSNFIWFLQYSSYLYWRYILEPFFVKPWRDAFLEILFDPVTSLISCLVAFITAFIFNAYFRTPIWVIDLFLGIKYGAQYNITIFLFKYFVNFYFFFFICVLNIFTYLTTGYVIKNLAFYYLFDKNLASNLHLEYFWNTSNNINLIQAKELYVSFIKDIIPEYVKHTHMNDINLKTTSAFFLNTKNYLEYRCFTDSKNYIWSLDSLYDYNTFVSDLEKKTNYNLNGINAFPSYKLLSATDFFNEIHKQRLKLFIIHSFLVAGIIIITGLVRGIYVGYSVTILNKDFEDFKGIISSLPEDM